MIKLSDEWQTPQWLFDELNAEFNFDIDLCASEDNSKCPHRYSDYLNNRARIKSDMREVWCEDIVSLEELCRTETTCFMNPPYSKPAPFIEKAWEDSKYCKIVALVKCDPSTQWWATFWNYDYCEACEEQPCINDSMACQYDLNHKRGPKLGCEVRFFPKRIKFDPPQQLIDSGEAFKMGNTWCIGHPTDFKICSGPTFPSALIIMDRREL